MRACDLLMEQDQRSACLNLPYHRDDMAFCKPAGEALNRCTEYPNPITLLNKNRPPLGCASVIMDGPAPEEISLAPQVSCKSFLFHSLWLWLVICIWNKAWILECRWYLWFFFCGGKVFSPSTGKPFRPPRMDSLNLKHGKHWGEHHFLQHL